MIIAEARLRRNSGWRIGIAGAAYFWFSKVRFFQVDEKERRVALALLSLTVSGDGGYQPPSAPRSDYARVPHTPVFRVGTLN